MRAHTKLSARFVRNRSGVVAVYVALGLPAFLAAIAITIDMGSAYVTRNKLQITADAAALAGASALPEGALTKNRALDAASTNMPLAAYGQVLHDADIVTGNWASATRTFVAGGTPANAVKVTTRRSSANGNPLRMMIAHTVGIATMDVGAIAIATADATDDCFRNGIVANGQIEVGSNSTFGVGACMHGQLGFKIGSNNQFMPGSVISMPDPDSMIVQGSNNVFSGEIVAQELSAMTNDKVEDLLESIKDTASNSGQIGDLDEMPPWFDGTVVNVAGDFKQCTPTKGKLYVVTGVADLSSCTGTLDGFGIYAEKEIKLGSGQSSSKLLVTNMFFASNLIIETGSYIRIGTTNFCNVGQGAVFFAAREKFKVGSNVDMYGVQIISGTKSLSETGVEFGSNLFTSGVSAQSAGLVKMGSNPTISVCDRADHVLTGGTVNKVLRLVD